MSLDHRMGERVAWGEVEVDISVRHDPEQLAAVVADAQARMQAQAAAQGAHVDEHDVMVVERYVAPRRMAVIASGPMWETST